MAESERETWVEVIDEGMREIVDEGAAFRCIGEGMKFTEGPVWREDENSFLFSDLGDNKIWRWSETDGLKLFRDPTNKTNGNTTDREGRLISCEHLARRVTRTEKDGTIVSIATTYCGAPLNSPNDVVVKSDGTIWFTDPPYGVSPELVEQKGSYVYRLDEGASEPVALVTDMTRPNGLCFSPDESLLYVANSDTDVHHIRCFSVLEDNTLGGGEVFTVIEPHVPDGIRVDAKGNFYSTAGDGVQVFDPEGRILGRLHTPEVAANCRFGGPERRQLLITASTRVWLVDMLAQGVD